MEKKMNKMTAIASIVAGVAALGATSASAMPLDSRMSDTVAASEQVRLVCDEWGRCWRVGPRRYYRYGYAPRRYHRYYGEPRYYAYGGPRYYPRHYGGPVFSFGFGF